MSAPAAITMTAAAAWAVFGPELLAVTVENWTDDDYADEPYKRQLAADVTAGVVSADVLDEILDCLTRDWCVGAVERAALVLLAVHGRLDAWSATTTYSRRPRTSAINGVRYVIG